MKLEKIGEDHIIVKSYFIDSDGFSYKREFRENTKELQWYILNCNGDWQEDDTEMMEEKYNELLKK